MVDVDKLKTYWIRKGLTQKQIAKELNISSKSLCCKLKKGILGSDEIKILTSLLEIDNPMEIFFKK